MIILLREIVTKTMHDDGLRLILRWLSSFEKARLVGGLHCPNARAAVADAACPWTVRTFHECAKVYFNAKEGWPLIVQRLEDAYMIGYLWERASAMPLLRRVNLVDAIPCSCSFPHCPRLTTVVANCAQKKWRLPPTVVNMRLLHSHHTCPGARFPSIRHLQLVEGDDMDVVDLAQAYPRLETLTVPSSHVHMLNGMRVPKSLETIISICDGRLSTNKIFYYIQGRPVVFRTPNDWF